MLQRFLPLVLEHSAEAEVIVADNASTDQSVAMMREHFPQVRLVLLLAPLPRSTFGARLPLPQSPLLQRLSSSGSRAVTPLMR